MTGFTVCDSSAIAARNPSRHRSASPILLKTRSCGGKRHGRLGIFRHHNGRAELALIEQRTRWNIAAGRRNQKQHRNRRALTAIRQHRDGVAFEAPVAMRFGAGAVAECSQDIAETAVSVNMTGVDCKRGFELFARGSLFAEPV